MIKEIREVQILEKSGKTKSKIEYLILCMGCKIEFWTDNSRRKSCSVKCINVGKKHTDENKQKRSLASIGEKNHFFGKKHSPEILKKISENVKKGLENMSDEKKENVSKLWKEKEGQKNSFFGRKHTKESREKMSKTRAINIASGKTSRMQGINGIYFSEKTKEKNRYDSFYEYLYMKILDDDPDVKFWTKNHGIKIKYFFDSVNKHYIPDFLIEKNDKKIIVEVKGYEEKNKLEAKINAVKEFVLGKKWIFDFVSGEILDNLSKEKYNKGILTKRREFKNGEF